MNLLLLPFPDEVLLEYLLPQDMVSLCKTNSVYYKNFKPLIYKAFKKYFISKQGEIASVILNSNLCFMPDFKFVGLINGSSLYMKNLPDLFFFYYNIVDERDLFNYAKRVLKKIKIMKEEERFCYNGGHGFNFGNDKFTLTERTFKIPDNKISCMCFTLYDNKSQHFPVCDGFIHFFNAKYNNPEKVLKDLNYITPTFCHIVDRGVLP